MAVALEVVVVVVVVAFAVVMAVAAAMTATVYGPLVDIIMVWLEIMNLVGFVDVCLACKYL